MLLVKASVKPSKIHGLGLFADEKIPKGTMVWEFDPKFDLVFSEKEVGKMSEIQQNLIHKFAYFSKRLRKYVYCVDDTRFMNHSNAPNTDSVSFSNKQENCDVANKDIGAGEEMTINYRDIDLYDEKSKESYLNN